MAVIAEWASRVELRSRIKIMSRPYVMGDRMVLGEDLDDGTCLWKRRLLVRLWGVRGSVGDVLERRDFMLELKLTM